MEKREYLLLAIMCALIFVLVYSPHQTYHFPLHIDEWYHINEAKKLNSGEYLVHGNFFRIGFQVFLAGCDRIADLVLIYQYLPAIWAVLIALTLFYTIYMKTKNYWIAVLSVLFFASLKSNVNIQGLWFFIPSVFAYLFVYLYVYFFTTGLEEKNKKYILLSLGIMLLVLFIHSVSLFFAIPFLFVYSFFYYRYIIKEWKFFSLFLLIPVLGFLIYVFATNSSFLDALSKVFSELSFEKGRTPLEWDNSFFEIYSLIGYIFAVLGFAGIFVFEKDRKKYLPYALWTVFTLVSIFAFRIFGVSFLAPYQRMFYYFALSLPLISAFGVYYIFKLKDNLIGRMNFQKEVIYRLKLFFGILLIVIILYFSFINYYDQPTKARLYHPINNEEYSALVFLKNQSDGILLAKPMVSMAAYPVSGKTPVGTIFFYGDKQRVEKFFSSTNCSQWTRQVWVSNSSYVLSDKRISCGGWKLIYNNSNYLYNTREIIASKSREQ